MLSSTLPPAPAVQAYHERVRRPFGRYLAAVEGELVFELLGPVSGKRALDLGTGTGTFARELAERGASMVVAVDLDEKMLRMSRARVRAHEIGWTVGDAFSPGLAPESFDLVLGVGIFEVIPNGRGLNDALAIAADLLKPGGRAVLTFWNRHRPLPYGWLDFGPMSMRFQVSPADLPEAAAAAGLRLLELRSTLFEPRRLVPALLRLARPAGLEESAVDLLVAINRRLGGRFPLAGRELVLALEKERSGP